MIAILCIEGAHIGEEAGTEKAITNQLGLLLLERFNLAAPTASLAAQAVNEPACCVQSTLHLQEGECKELLQRVYRLQISNILYCIGFIAPSQPAL